MRMAPRAAAWVAWAVWTCNTPQPGMQSKRAGFGPLFFFVSVKEYYGNGGVRNERYTGELESLKLAE
jgi:hypothetical protein